MDVSVIALIFVFLTFQFSFIMFDFQHNQNMKQDIFSNIRTANQNALLQVQNDYNEYKELTENAMLEAWLENFVKQNNLDFNDIELGFVQIETDPPLFLVTVEGAHGDYRVINKQALVSYVNGTMIISELDDN